MKTSYYYILLTFIAIQFCTTSCRKDLKVVPIHIIPQPVNIIDRNQSPFVIDDHSLIYVSDSSMMFAAEYLLNLLDDDYEIQWIDSGIHMNSGILFKFDHLLEDRPDGAYSIDVHSSHITLSAKNTIGLWYAVQSMQQILPTDKISVKNTAIPSITIEDEPRFSWRGMHLDVSRHFMPLPFIKKYIDFLAFHKLNVFHWHLVDGIGWRIEIKSHPELTDIGAWRVVKEDKQPWEDFEVWRTGDTRQKYGGYYTQAEIKEVVKYAAQRSVVIVPEIELPGHSEVVMQCYPDLLCIDAQGQPLDNIGVYCANEAKSYRLLEDILEEVIDLFPSQYIHIGGDEVNKSNWEQCIRCQTLMTQHHLNPKSLQSRFINHFDKFLRIRGRNLIGWHEIVEGKLSPTAAVMYWGRANNIEDYFQKGHQMVLTPGSPYYFDHYQSNSIHEPQAFGGLSTLKDIYEFEAFPAEWDNLYKENMMGIQANVWTEYMKDTNQVEYMVFPRIAALAESAWIQRDQKDWSRFRSTVPLLFQHYKKAGIEYSKSSYRPLIQIKLDTALKKLKMVIEPELESKVYYSIDKEIHRPKDGTLYKHPVVINHSATIHAISTVNKKVITEPESKQAYVHQGIGQKAILHSQPSTSYQSSGAKSLVNGDFGGNNWGNGKWIGVLNKAFEATIEMDSPKKIQRIGYSAIEDQQSGIYFPDQISISTSTDGVHYQSLANLDIDSNTITYSSKTKDSIFYISFEPTTLKYLKFTAKPPIIENKGRFLFVDELIIE